MGSRGAGLPRGSGGAAAGDASFMNPSESFNRYIRQRRDVDPDGKFDLIAHGTPNGIQIEHNGIRVLINSRTAAQMIKRLPDYNGQPIRLLSCNTGARAEGFAQNLANKLGVVVEAPSDIIWAYPNGRHVIAPNNGKGKPDLRKRGHFIQYKPGGNKR